MRRRAASYHDGGQKTHKPMQDREVAFAAVTFSFDAEGCDLDSLDAYQQLCQSAAVSKGAHGVFPADGVFPLLTVNNCIKVRS
jgi:hypothetical protein